MKMTPVTDDKELVRDYLTQGSDAAFRALVSRHIDLVYATALRQMGEAEVAEEITQNVFVALARKAPRLAGRQTLAGWLYRTTLLETKARIRAELRRRRREEKALEISILERQGVSPLEEMAPLLDEGLLNLKEHDRTALVLRFLENRSLREVGEALGIDEDAARKRVSRALERLARFFRGQGFATSVAATSATLLTGAAKAAPAPAAIYAAQAGLAAGGNASGLNLLLTHFMALTKTQTAAICLLFAAAPIVWQQQAEARIANAQTEASATLAANRESAAKLEQQAERGRQELLRLQTQAQNASRHLEQTTAQVQGRTPRPGYRWDGNSSVARLPKAVLEQLPLSAVSNHRGQLNEQIKEALQMTEAEAQQTQGALDRFVASFNAVQAAMLRPVEPKREELAGHEAADTRVFEVPALGDRLAGMRDDLLQELEATLGSQRFQMFRKALRDWMPVDDKDTGMNSSMAVFNFDHRVIFYKPAPGNQWLDWQIRKANGEMMRFGVELDDVPAAFRPHVQDWITLGQSQPVR